MQLPASVSAQEYWTRIFLNLLGISQDCVVFLHDWNADSKDEGLLHIIEGFRKTFGHEERSLVEAPGHLFSRDELSLVSGLVRIIMAFEWGAYLINVDQPETVIDIFDCFARVICRDDTALAQARDLLASAGATELPSGFLAGDAATK